MNSIGREDYRTALSFNREALNLIGRNRVIDYSAFVRAQNDISLIKSLDGDYAQAVTILEGILPIAKALRTTHPYLYFDYLNNLAAELNEVGRFEEATYPCDVALASQFAHAYPEGHEKRQEIEIRKRARGSRASQVERNDFRISCPLD